MDRLLLKRYHADGGDRHYLSLLSAQGWSLCEDHQNLVLPFSKNSAVKGSSCGGLLYFDNLEGKIIICNPTTRAMKLLEMRRPPNDIIFHCSGFGYDHKSDDYKVVRIFQNYCKGNQCHYCRRKRCRDNIVEVFSLKSDSWKEIKVADFGFGDNFDSSSGVYVNGAYYWIRYNFKFNDDVSLNSSIVSFDFTRECFSNISLPPPGKDLLDDVVKVDDDMLGVIRYERPSERMGVFTTFQLLVLKESSWVPWVCVDLLCDVERPLLLNEGRFLFFEKKISDRMRQLVVYDLETKELEELDIYDYIELKIVSYFESRFPLRDSKPIDGSYSKEEEEREDEKVKERLEELDRMFRGDFDYEIQNQARRRRSRSRSRRRRRRGYQIQNQWMDQRRRRRTRGQDSMSSKERWND